MPSYRGVEQADLIRSIQDGLALLEKNSTGPECQKFLDALRKPDASGKTKLDAIVAAQDDQSLTNALLESQASYVFARGYRLMKYHALNNTGGKGRGVWKALNRWGAFDGIMTCELNAYDREINRFMDEHSLRLAFNMVVANITGKTKELKEAGPIGRYGVVIEGLSSGDVALNDPSLKPLSEVVYKTLEPFQRLDEVQMTGIGLILAKSFEKGDPQGIVFQSTRRAAEAVAAAIPHRNVINHKGKVITPPAPNTAP